MCRQPLPEPTRWLRTTPRRVLSPSDGFVHARAMFRCLLLSFLFCAHGFSAEFRAGAHATDISPTKLPVIVNAMFEERSADKVVDPLFAKALVLDNGATRIALC